MKLSEERNNSLEIKIYEKAFKNATETDVKDKYLNKLSELYKFQNNFIATNNCSIVSIVYDANLIKGRISKINYMPANIKKKVIQMDLTGKFIKRFESIASASIITGIPKTTIKDSLNNRWKVNSGGGYYWKHAK